MRCRFLAKSVTAPATVGVELSSAFTTSDPIRGWEGLGIYPLAMRDVDAQVRRPAIKTKACRVGMNSSARLNGLGRQAPSQSANKFLNPMKRDTH